MIGAVIIDDDPECVEDLIYLIKKHKYPLEVLATANSGAEGLAVILKHKPQLIFLDVVMPGMTGFEMLELLPQLDFHLIITTSMDKYAVQAIRFSALDFLLKPVKVAELTNAIERLKENEKQNTDRAQVNLLAQTMREPARPLKKIALVIKEGVQLVELENVIYFKSDGNYTTVFLTGGEEILVSKPIGNFEETVHGTSFYRVHNSYLINLDHVSKFIRSDGGYLILDDNTNVPVSRSKKDELLKLLSGI